jgi:hypothetical protein
MQGGVRGEVRGVLTRTPQRRASAPTRQMGLFQQPARRDRAAQKEVCEAPLETPRAPREAPTLVEVGGMEASYCRFRLQPRPASPTRPEPRRSKVAGSGTEVPPPFCSVITSRWQWPSAATGRGRSSTDTTLPARGISGRPCSGLTPTRHRRQPAWWCFRWHRRKGEQPGEQREARRTPTEHGQ